MWVSRILGIVAIAVVLVLSGCGGGGGGGPLPPRDRVTPIEDKYPDCQLSSVVGKANIAGCWLSERCATIDGVPVRYLAEITEEVFSPITKGSIYDYLLVYDSPNCEGNPVDVVSIADRLLDTENATLRVRYIKQGDDGPIPLGVCSDTQGEFDRIPCLTIDISSEYQRDGGPVSRLNSKDAYHYGGGPKINGDGSSSEWYLCMSSAYQLDDEAYGGIGVGLLPQTRDTVIDFTDCLTRFEPKYAR